MEERLKEVRKKVLTSALKKAFEYFPIEYVLMCYDEIIKNFNVVVKFREKPTLHASDLHDYIYNKYGIDPRFYVINTLNPLTKVRMLEECEFVEGDKGQYEEDLRAAKREAESFANNLKEIAKLYGVLKNE